MHRIGRTGRVGREGKAISLVTKREQPKLDAIQKLLGIPIPKWTVPGDEVARRARRTSPQATEPDVGAAVVATVPAGDATGDGEVRRKRRWPPRRPRAGARAAPAATASAE